MERRASIATSPRHGESGVTLLEMMVVLVVIGILASLISPIVSGWLRRSGEKTCIANLMQIQTNMRAFAALKKIPVGGALTHSQFIGATNSLMSAPECPSGKNAYAYLTSVPPPHTAYASCTAVPDLHYAKDDDQFPP
jgi:prepilin-type N-terminal cleavage/methylation domain